MSEAVFPPEIEHVIFLNALALKENGESPINLILVAKRVHSWLMPQIMKTFALSTLPPVQKYPFPWDIHTLHTHGKHVRNLFIWKSDHHTPNLGSLASHLISLCPHITDLVLWSKGSSLSRIELEQISRLEHLTHLSINLSKVPKSAWEKPEFAQAFSRITHLENVADIRSHEDLIIFKHFTSITHLAISGCEQDTLLLLFTRLPTLEVLIVWEVDDHDTLMVVDQFNPHEDDPRIVRVACAVGGELDAWLSEVQKGQGMWGLADQAVGERKKLKEASRKGTN
ncbi:hypothetical protein BDN72DRAFT_959446 [Pluteus cervinus]|uniref:Uncharacterized protein n=1 Tax=Pluteus cervinus TaxID=181527 RepID=A0ACD3AW50_9AGAR|nr:hypothetical protein BDN72DRAFT_959446 [Pluteus cervinus]